MMNSNLGELNSTQDYYENNNSNDLSVEAEGNTPMVLGWSVWISISFIICCIGMVGNGYIIWLLGFQIKRNSFTTLILNLAVADFGYLASIFIYIIPEFACFEGDEIFDHFCTYFIRVMYISANFLLTTISIDRCLCVLFPMWHHFFRPKDLSSVACGFLWISSLLLSGIIIVMEIFLKYEVNIICFLLIAIVCLPLITISTVVLFIKVCFKPKQTNKGRLLLMILITLLCYLILDFPLCVFAVIIRFSSTNFDNQLGYWTMCSMLFSCLNSCINPVIYFLLGRKKGTQSKESLKIILQKVFKEDEPTGEELNSTFKTSVLPPE